MVDFGSSCNFDFNLLDHKTLRSSKLAPKGLRVLEPIITLYIQCYAIRSVVDFGSSCYLQGTSEFLKTRFKGFASSRINNNWNLEVRGR